MKTIVDKIFSLGTADLEESYKAGVVRISNIIALIFFLTGIIYSAISAYLAPNLINVCLMLLFGSLIILFLNFLGYVDGARLMLTFLISLDVAVYHAMVVQPGEPLIVSIYIGQFVVTILPFVYIDLREKALLTTALIFSFAVFLAQPLTNEWINVEMDSSIFRDKLFTIPTYIFSIGAVIYSMYLLQNKNLRAQKKVNLLLQDLRKKNAEMKQQQEELLQTLEENKIAHDEEEKRNWIAKGLSEIGQYLRGEINEAFYKDFVSAIVDYLRVNQVGVYVVEEENENEKYIHLKACYAFDRHKFLQKKIEIGQGLVGQCYLEKERIYLKEVPDSYITITSGLGDAPPKCILIVPLVHEENVEGIIEIASFHQLQDHEIDFVEKLSGSLASYIAANRINLHTKILLERYQMQSEELRAQEEEMRQNMEEMQATQEEINRKEQEYLRRIEELEKELLRQKDI